MVMNLECQKCGNKEGWMFTADLKINEVREHRWIMRVFGPTRRTLEFQKVVCEGCVVKAVLGESHD